MVGTGSPGLSGISGGNSPVNSPSLMHNSLSKTFFSLSLASKASLLAFKAANISTFSLLASSICSSVFSELCFKLTLEAVKAKLCVDSDKLWLKFDMEQEELLELKLNEDLVKSRAISFKVLN